MSNFDRVREIVDVCTMITADNTELTEEIIAKRDDLYSGIKSELENIPVTVTSESNTVLVNFQDILICGVEIMEETYRIFHVSENWKSKTTYLCQKAEDDTWYYYLETIDECIGETIRLIDFEVQKHIQAPRPEISHINDYGNNSKAFCLNAADWFNEIKREGKIEHILSSRGISKQNIITPGLCLLHKHIGINADKLPEPITFFYQIEIKTVHDKGTAVYKLVAHQTPEMQSRVREFLKNTMIPKMGRTYRDDGTWYDMRFGSMKIKSDTVGADIYDFLDQSLSKAESFERALLCSLNINLPKCLIN